MIALQEDRVTRLTAMLDQIAAHRAYAAAEKAEQKEREGRKDAEILAALKLSLDFWVKFINAQGGEAFIKVEMPDTISNMHRLRFRVRKPRGSNFSVSWFICDDESVSVRVFDGHLKNSLNPEVKTTLPITPEALEPLFDHVERVIEHAFKS